MRIHIAAVALVAAVAAVPAAAERVTDKAWLSGSALFATADSSLRLDSTVTNGLGTTLSFEKDLGLSSHDTTPLVLGGLRIGKGWRVEAEYLRLHRTGNHTLDRTAIVGDTTFDVNANVAGLLESDTIRIVGGYAPIRGDNYELGGSLGFHVTKFKAQVLGIGSVNGTTSALVAKAADQTAPLPTLGLYGNYTISPLFTLNARVDYLSLKIGDYSGKLIDTRGTVSVRPLRYLSLGGGYQYVEYDVSARKKAFTGKVTYKFRGPVLFAELDF
jgi:hypothetical protein